MDSLNFLSLDNSSNFPLILLSGVDEFPKKELFDNVRDMTKDFNMDAVSFKMKTFYYSPLTEVLIDCFATVAINDFTLRNMLRFNDLRDYTFNCTHIENGGYHLSFFMSPEDIRKDKDKVLHPDFKIYIFFDDICLDCNPHTTEIKDLCFNCKKVIGPEIL